MDHLSRIICWFIGHKVIPNPLLSFRRHLGNPGGEFECSRCYKVIDDPAIKAANRR